MVTEGKPEQKETDYGVDNRKDQNVAGFVHEIVPALRQRVFQVTKGNFADGRQYWSGIEIRDCGLLGHRCLQMLFRNRPMAPKPHTPGGCGFCR
jgi:hypothetical protein